MHRVPAPWFRSASRPRASTAALALFAALGAVPGVVPAQEQRAEDTLTFKAVSVVGRNGKGDALPGSAHYLGRESLDRQDYADIHRVLREVPGVEVREEDGYGTRPHIGIRGTSIERAEKVAVLEDGILAAPAPYSSPAAYYFPSVGRMHAVEVRKGSSQVPYGPSTTGGVLNFVSTPIPAANSGKLRLMLGEQGTARLHAHYGGSGERWGWLAETYQHQADGFKELPGHAAAHPDRLQKQGTGFDRGEWLGKLRFNSSPSAEVYQELEFKAGRTDEVSDETYLGLTRADFEANPYRRYAASAADNLDVDQTQFSARYFVRPADWFDITARLYRQDVHRNWYKLNDVRNSANTGWVSLSAVLADPATYSHQYRILAGDTNSPNGLRYRANNRKYHSQGAQVGTEVRQATGPVSHTLNVGARYHYDEEDRFQHDDRYGMQNGSLAFVSRGAPGSQTNQVVSTHAWSVFAEDALKWERFTLTPGLRFERLDYKVKNWGTAVPDPDRKGDSLKVTDSDLDVLVWGLGLGYAAAPGLNLFTGVHRGFQPPGPNANDSADAEKSVNVEAGARYRDQRTSLQAVAFANFYSNLLGRETAAGGGASTRDIFNGGKARVQGLELAAARDVGDFVGAGIGLPLRIAYTYTHGEFLSDFRSGYAPWDSVKKGYELPHLANHNLLVGAGVEYGPVAFDAAAAYTGAMRNKAGSGPIPGNQKLGDYTTVDVTGSWRVAPRLKVVGSVKNLFDEVGVASLLPSGLRPNMPRLFTAGIQADL